MELGCGLTGLIGRVLSQSVQRYILTDQPSIVRHLKSNLLEGSPHEKTAGTKSKKKSATSTGKQTVLEVMALDWEKDAASNLKAGLSDDAKIDLLILCDCVYNEYLVKPLVQTCVDTCRLGWGGDGDGYGDGNPTVVLVAQQLRSDAILELFLETMIKEFEVWRVPEERITTDLGPNSGYAVHLAILRERGVGC